jgi:anti-anti-sigma regulatory factor
VPRNRKERNCKVLLMAMIAVWLKIDEDRVVQALQEAREKLDSADGEVVLDFSSVGRVDPAALRALQELAGAAEEKAVKVVLRGVNVGVYKVLKLVKLAPRFAFSN